MLADRRQAAGRKRERKPPQRRKSVPLFGWISQDPLYRTCFIIDADEKIFPARNDNRVVRPIVSHGRCYGTSRLASGKQTGWDHLLQPSWRS